MEIFGREDITTKKIQLKRRKEKKEKKGGREMEITMLVFYW